MKNSTIIRVVILGVIAIIVIIGLQSYWVINTWNINEEDFNKKANLALYNVAKTLAAVRGAESPPPRSVIKQITSNYYIVDIEEELNPVVLEFYLKREFDTLMLKDLNVEYAIYDCSTGEMVYGQCCTFAPQEETEEHSSDFPRDSNLTYYFSVRFPDRSSYLFGKIQLSVLFSFILLLTIIFFAYSISVILHQKRLSEMQKDFINNMTHEFKTPISTIKLSAEFFINHPLIKEDTRLAQYADIIKSQNQRLNQQVEKVLQLAKIEKDQFKLKLEEVDLVELIKDCLEAVELNVQKKGGNLTYELPTCPIQINADPLHLSNIIDNLLDNAIKYSKNAPNITLGLFPKGKYVTLQIKDQGIGIPKVHQTKVFNKFYRVPTGNVHNVKGFGLGLHYVKSICTAHGWFIQLNSDEGQGTRITIQFPRIR